MTKPVIADYDDLLDDVVGAVREARALLIGRTNATMVELYLAHRQRNSSTSS